MTREEIAFLESHLRPTDHVFEWGSGDSTVWLAQRVRYVTSVEHDPTWAARTTLNLVGRLNTSVLWVPPLRPYTEGADDGDPDVFRQYILAILGQPADVVLIDGRSRVGCAVAAAEVLEPPRLFFLHDCERAEYAPIWETYLREVGRVGNLMALTVRS
jgi:hypothetical protein